MDEEINARFDVLGTRFDKLEKRFDKLEIRMDTQFDAMNERFADVTKLLIRLQSDLRMFYRELGYHDARLDNLEGK